MHTDSQNRSRRDPNGALAEYGIKLKTHHVINFVRSLRAHVPRKDAWYIRRRMLTMELPGKSKRVRPKKRFMDAVREDMIVLSGCDGGRRLALGESRLEKNPLWRPLTRAAERRRRSIRAHAAEDRWYCDIHWVLFYSVVVSAWNILQLILFLLDIGNFPS